MTLVLKNNNCFRNIIRYMKDISSDVSLLFYDEIFKLQTTDIFNKILIDINIKKSHFFEYKMYENITVNIINLHKILLFANRFSEIHMIFNNNILNLNILSENIQKKFRVPIFMKGVERKIIDIDYSTKIVMGTKELYDIIKRCEEINNNVIIEINNNEINFYSQGEFSSININKKIETPISCNFKMKYNTKNLLNICKIYKITDKLDIFFHKDLPIKFETNMEDIEINIFLVHENI